jgi:flagellar hook-associated protein 1 FlgK
MGLFDLLNIARDGVTAQQAALTTTGSNISNVSTPGYTRRTAVLTTNISGGGVTYAATQRTFDRFAYAHVVDEQGKFSAADTRSSALADIETAIAPPSGTIGDQSTELVKSFDALSANPIDPTLRADVLAKTTALSNAVASTYQALQGQSQNLLGQAQDTVTNLNQSLKQIADLNEQIATAQGLGGDSSDLRDQRDLAIKNVGEQIGAKSIEDSSGSVTLYAAGSVLVEGNHASSISMDLDPATSKMRFYATNATKTDITSRVDTGTLGGLIEGRDVDLAKTIDSVNSYAYDVSNAFNAVHMTGYGSDGTTGRPLFAVPTSQNTAAESMALDPGMVGHPEFVAASASASDLPGGNDVMLQLAQLSDTQSFGGQTLTDRFANMATDVGFRKNSADAETSLRTDTLAVAQQVSDSSNGVSIDEEMVNLTQYQRAFQASTKVLQTADQLLQNLMDALT